MEIFEGMDFEELANSESPIIETPKESVISQIQPPAEAVPTPAGETKTEDPNAVDLDALADLETIEILPTGKEKIDNEEGGETKNSSRTPAEAPEKPSPSSPELISSFAKGLKEAGVLSSFDEEELKEITSIESLYTAIEKQVRQNEHSALNEDQKALLKAFELGVPTEFVASKKTSAQQYNKISEEQIENNAPLRYELIRRSFLIKGFDGDTAGKYAKLAIDTEDEGIEEATQAKLALVAHEESALQAEISKRESDRENKNRLEAEALSALKSKVLETSEILPGIQVNATTKDKIFNSLTAPTKVEDGEPLNEVMAKYKEDQNYKLKLHALHVITKGFTDFSKFTNTSKSKATKEFEDLLNSTGSGRTGAPSRSSTASGVTEGLSAKAIGEALKNL